MATVAPPADRILSHNLEAADLLQKFSLDSQTKTSEIPEPAKKPPVDSGDVTNGQIQSLDRSLTPFLPDFMDPTMYYIPNVYASYYYGGYDGTGNEWEDYSRYMNPDGVEMTHGAYGDNGSLVYHHGYGYAPYVPYSPAGSPVPTVGHDGQPYGAQQYQFPTPYFQTLAPTSGPFSSPAALPKGEISSIGAADQVPSSVEAPKGSSNGIGNGGGLKGNNGSAPLKTAYQNSSYVNGSYGRGALRKGIAVSGYQDPRFGYDGVRSPIPWTDGPLYSDGHPRSVISSSIASSISSGNGITSSRNQNVRPHSHLMGLHNPRPMSGLNTTNGFMNRMYPNKLYSQYGNAYRSGYYGSNGYDSRTSGCGWSTVDSKCKPRGRGNWFLGYGNENMDGLNELNRGPRAKSTKNQKGLTPIALAVRGRNIPLTGTNDCEEKPCVNHNREQHNRADFPENYADAKFFIIKSYSEDDVHKSIKYNVWASTQNGNKKLDAAYQDAQQKSGNCPIFLFFSVNTSGQFVGVAEMLGPIDFNKSLEYWQQDKWVGCFPVKWHIVKDVPNSMLKHITLENNENKPVTNSRDTQEVKLEQGLELLKIFKDHSSKQCILDDFDFYEERQKRIQEKKAKQQQFQKQVWEGKPTDEKNKEGSSQKLTDVALDLIKDVTPAIQTNGYVQPSENPTFVEVGDGPITKPVVVIEKKVIPNVKPLENPTVVKVGDGPINKPVVVIEKKVLPNVVANGC